MTATIQVRATGYYPFNGNANDESTSGKNGVVTGATLTTDRFGVANKAYLFANATTYISLPNTVTNGLTNFSIFMWVTSTATGTVDDYVFSNARAAQFNEFGLGFHTNGTGMRILRGATFSDITCPKVNDGNWHHVGVVRSGTTWSHYFDGVKLKDTTIDDTALIVGANGFVLGQEQDSVGGGFTNAQAWIGKIDEVIILPVALTATEVSALYNITSRHDLNDVFVDGKFGKGIEMFLFGLSAYGKPTFGASLDLGASLLLPYNSCSISWWYKANLNAFSNWSMVRMFSNGEQAGSGRIDLNSSNYLLWESYSNNAWQMNAPLGIDVDDGNWHHYVLTAGTTNAKCYVDGALVHTGTPNSNAVNQQFRWIGAYYNSTYSYGSGLQGTMDEVLFFTKELSSSEVTILFNASGKV